MSERVLVFHTGEETLYHVCGGKITNLAGQSSACLPLQLQSHDISVVIKQLKTMLSCDLFCKKSVRLFLKHQLCISIEGSRDILSVFATLKKSKCPKIYCCVHKSHILGRMNTVYILTKYSLS